MISTQATGRPGRHRAAAVRIPTGPYAGLVIRHRRPPTRAARLWRAYAHLAEPALAGLAVLAIFVLVLIHG